MPTTPGRRPAPAPDPSHFRHSYSKDKAQLVRRLSRMEGQVRGIARMIEREEYCIDILQQTAALRAAVDALSIVLLEDHVQGCVRTAAEARPGRRSTSTRSSTSSGARSAVPSGERSGRDSVASDTATGASPVSYPRNLGPIGQLVDNRVDAPRRCGLNVRHPHWGRPG